NGIFQADMVLIGEETEEVGNILENIYNILSPSAKICRMSPTSAEITKLAINCFITTKIAFANMIGDIASKTNENSKTITNSEDILNAIGSDSRIGQKCLKYGYGFGGPCFPRDNRALGKYAKKIGVEPLLCVATNE